MGITYKAPRQLVDFFNDNNNASFISSGPLSSIDEIRNSGIGYIRMGIHFPYAEIYKEAHDLIDRFVSHRTSDHRGWKSLALHSVGDEHETSSTKGVYNWTEIADLCPITKSFIENCPLYTGEFFRIRFMLLEPSGFILPHNDTQKLRIINFALNNPDGCSLIIENHGTVPFASGRAYLLDISQNHIAWNQSDEPRLHLIIHGKMNIGILEEIALKAIKENNYG